MNSPIISTSYLQDQKHAQVSDRYNVIQAASVGEVMAQHGLDLISLSTGRAKHEDKKDFQRTLSRYAGPTIGDGVRLDIIYDSKHMGRGVDKILLGIYRMVCTNGLFVGTNFFKYEVRHSGQTYETLNAGISQALAMQTKLAELISKMQGINLNNEQIQTFALDAVKLLTPENAVQVRHRLLNVRRIEDQGSDLWTVFNVIQENAVQGKSVRYTLAGQDENGRDTVRHMSVRALRPNSGRDADFNQGLFDLAARLAA